MVRGAYLLDGTPPAVTTASASGRVPVSVRGRSFTLDQAEQPLPLRLGQRGGRLVRRNQAERQDDGASSRAGNKEANAFLIERRLF